MSIITWNNLPIFSNRFDPSLSIKDEADYKRQLAEWEPTLQLIGRHRLGHDVLKLIQYKMGQLHDLWFSMCLISVKTPRLIHKMSETLKAMPMKGGDVLRMRRYEVKPSKEISQ